MEESGSKHSLTISNCKLEMTRISYFGMIIGFNWGRTLRNLSFQGFFLCLDNNLHTFMTWYLGCKYVELEFTMAKGTIPMGGK